VTDARSSSPIFIIGTERSGSNLLRLMLNSHSRIAIPHPPHFMRYLAPLAHTYGDLASEANRRVLVRDALTLLRRHIHPWPRPIDRERVVRCASPSVFGVVAAIYEEFRLGEGKPRWGCKSTFMVEHVSEVLAEYPDALFIWLVRDPCDVASSAKRAVFGYCCPFRMAQLWNVQQNRAAAALSAWGPQVLHLIRYEDLVTSPATEVARLCAFIGEQVEPAMLVPQRSPEAGQVSGLSESWGSTRGPISARFIGGNRSGLTVRERLQVDNVTMDLKKEFGYDVDPNAALVRRPSGVETAVRGVLLRARVEYRSLRKDRNCTVRWARDATVRWLLLKSKARQKLAAAWRAD